MRYIATIAVLAMLPFSLANVFSQDAGCPVATGKTSAIKGSPISGDVDMVFIRRVDR